MHGRASERMTDKSLLMLLRVMLPSVALALALTGYFLNENAWWRWTVAVDTSALLCMLSWLAILPVDPSEGRWSLLRNVFGGVCLLYGAILLLHYLSDGQATPKPSDLGAFGLLVAVGLVIRRCLEVRFEHVRMS